MKKGLGPFRLWVIGLGLVISGDYFGWNFGVLTGGYWGMMIAIGIAAVMYMSMAFGIGEMAAAMPHTGGPYAFARRSMGQLAGFITGIGALLEYLLTTAVVALGVIGYVAFLFPGISPTLIAVILYIGFTAVHILGIKEYAVLETLLVLVALGLLAMFYIIGLPHVVPLHLTARPLLPHGWAGIWGCVPYAMWFFLGVEMLPMLSEECYNPRKDVPRSIILSMLTLLLLAGLTATVTIGLGGAQVVAGSANPLPDAVAVNLGTHHWLVDLLAAVGLFGLLASFSGLMLGYSRQTFALSRAGYLPGWLCRLHPDRKTPYWSLIVLGLISFLLAISFQAENLILVATFGALITYLSMNISVILLHRREVKTAGSFRLSWADVRPWISIILAAAALFSSIFRNVICFWVGVGTFAAASAYYFVWGRHHINSDAPEEKDE